MKFKIEHTWIMDYPDDEDWTEEKAINNIYEEMYDRYLDPDNYSIERIDIG